MSLLPTSTVASTLPVVPPLAACASICAARSATLAPFAARRKAFGVAASGLHSAKRKP
jgi:hypothetical protein